MLRVRRKMQCDYCSGKRYHGLSQSKTALTGLSQSKTALRLQNNDHHGLWKLFQIPTAKNEKFTKLSKTTQHVPALVRLSSNCDPY